MKYILLVLLAFLQVILVLVLSYKKHSSTSRMFMVLVSTIAIWTVGNVLLDYFQYRVHASTGALGIINKFDFFAGAASLLLSYRLSLIFPKEKPQTNFSKYVTTTGLAFMFFTLTSAVSGTFHSKPGELIATYTYGPLVASMGIFALGIIALGMKNFFHGYKTTDRVAKKQAVTIFSGLVLCIAFGIVFITVLPTLTGNENLIFLGYYSPFIFTGSILYSIIKQQLFDFRPIVARSVGYILSVVAMASVYSLVTFTIMNKFFFRGSQIDGVQQLAYATLAVATAFIFQPLQRSFNKITNRLFYRDAYDTQTVLDKVSGVIVGNVNPHKVQRGALSALADALKPTGMIFLLVDSAGRLRRGDAIGKSWDIQQFDVLQSTLKRVGKRILIYDEIEEQKSQLRDALKAENIGAVSPLVTKDETIGYLLLGPKNSGNIYNSQDIGLLTIATNELAVALQNAQRFDEIQAFNITLQEKVTEATQELKVTNKKLIALDEAKDEFISMASHQLRTPLTSIKGYLSMLVEGDMGKVTATQEKALKEAFGSSQRMVFLIADFLNVSRIKTGKFVIETREVDLPEVVREEITQLREMADSRELKLSYEQPEAFPRVLLDDNKIRQVMMNMVDNAIYYTPSGGGITIQLYADAEDIVFKVIDTGIGVPKAEQHKLFAKFYRAGNARKARPDGTGLGLFMAQKIVVEQGGSMVFESTEGKGSTFGFRFPLAKIKVKS